MFYGFMTARINPLRPQNIYSQAEKTPLFYHQIGNTNVFDFITNQ